MEGAEEVFRLGQRQPEMLDALVVLVEGDDIGDGLFVTVIVRDNVQCPRTFYTDLDNLICKSGQIICSGWSTCGLCHRVFLHQPNALARIAGGCHAHSRHPLTST
jgi:hypothetical protein